MGRLIRLLATVLTTPVIAAPVLAAVIVIGAATPAGACSCAPTDDVTAFGEADAVFVGTLDRFYEPRSTGGEHVAVAVFAVDTVYKGTVTERQAVATPGDSAACGLTFEPDTQYVVFASSSSSTIDDDLEPGFYAVAACGGTRPVGDRALGFDAPDQLPDIGEPTTSAIQAQLGNPHPSLFPEILIFFGVIVFVLAIASWHSLKRKRQATAG
jgi:hypothetical protein